jgi:uncharacterized protein
MAAVHEFSIALHDLDAAGRSYTFPVRAPWVRSTLEDRDIAPGANEGRLSVRASKSGTDVVIHGRLKAELVTPCARCLEPAHVTVDEPVSALMVPASSLKTPKEDEYEFSADEADVLPFDGEVVVLDDLVRDELVLGIPMIPLCSEDCPGMSLPPGFSGPKVSGEPVNDEDAIDPRLRPLLALKKMSTNKE